MAETARQHAVQKATTPAAQQEQSPRLWVLADNRRGNVSQAVGVAEGLGLPYVIKEIRYTRRARLPNSLLRPGFASITEESREALHPPWPKWVIAAGRRTAPIALGIKKQSGGQTKLIHIMDPQSRRGRFDCIILPEHDMLADSANILRTTAVPHKLSRAMLGEAAAEWRDPFGALPKPHIGLIVGGDSKAGRFTAANARRLGEQANALAEQLGGSLLVTTSPRTSRSATEALQQSITVPCFFHHWFYSGDDANPYPGIMALADRLIVTGDSMSMLSEACFTGIPLQIVEEGEYISDKHRRLHQALYSRGAAAPFGDGTGTPPAPTAPLDATADIVQGLRERLGGL